jgi:hypothetical protein
MPVRECLTSGCNVLSPGSRCPAHSSGASWNGTRDREAQRRFRAAVFAAAGGICQGIDGGVRCRSRIGLQAHHTRPGDDNPATGLLLCRPCHRAADRMAR